MLPRAKKTGNSMRAAPGPVGGMLLSAEHSLRTCPVAVGVVTAAMIAVITFTKLRTQGELSLALSYGIPVALCAYGIGFVAGTVTAFVVAVLWLFDAAEIGIPSPNEALAIFATRFAMDLGIVVFAALAAMAARSREAHAAAQRELMQLRTDLVSAFSHDLRTPLGAIVSYAHILKDELGNSASPEGLRRAIERIITNAERLNRLVSDMMGSQQGDGATPLQVSRFAPEALVTELQLELDQAVRRRPVVLDWEVDPHTPPLLTDTAKLTSIVRNLVSNAIKFTARGSVRIHISYDPAAAAHRIEVTDTGHGIPPDVLPHIFQRFYHGTQSGAGFGFGLFIVKRFTELLGGTIHVESEVGRGTRFVVTVPPLSAGEQPAEP